MKSMRIGPRAMSRNGKDTATPADISLERSGKSPAMLVSPPDLVQTNQVLICLNNTGSTLFST